MNVKDAPTRQATKPQRCLCCGEALTPETHPDAEPARYGLGIFCDARCRADYYNKFGR